MTWSHASPTFPIFLSFEHVFVRMQKFVIAENFRPKKKKIKQIRNPRSVATIKYFSFPVQKVLTVFSFNLPNTLSSISPILNLITNGSWMAWQLVD